MVQKGQCGFSTRGTEDVMSGRKAGAVCSLAFPSAEDRVHRSVHHEYLKNE